MIYYFDTSALIKRYLNETGSSWIRDLTQTTEHLFIASRLAAVEINSAFARRLREATVTQVEYADHLSAFDEDCRVLYHLIEPTLETLDLARDLVAKHPLRTLDALQLASAILANRVFIRLNLSALAFLSADDRLLQIARQEGLTTENPNAR